ncbi:Xylulose kinase [Hyphomicrobiales bacterium]|nr:Xylulose kinase [Hyphomicrobiales bacterium]CAH1690017.1 Xylulose kinase [Hyphomicrobiales bacterium]
MSGEPISVAIDLGTQSLRVSALSATGERLMFWQRPIATVIQGERYEQDSREWEECLLAGLDATAQAGIVPAAILASGPLAGFVPIAADGAPLAPAAMYNDRRSAREIPSVEQALPDGSAVARVTIADPLPQALRLMREEPEVLERTVHLLDATGWLNFSLTGRATINSYTGIRLYDEATRTRLGLATIPFGTEVAIGEVIAPLQEVLSSRLRWPRVPVVAATFDSKCAYLGSGIGVPGEGLDISGTVTSFGAVAGQHITDERHRIYSVPMGSSWLVRGSTAAAGSVLEWARQLLSVEISQIDALAAAETLDVSDPIFVPYLAGARAPLWQPEAQGAISGISLSTDRAAIARAIYAGLALSLRHIVETMEDCGAPVRSVRLAGGLSRSAALAQMKADILERPVTVMADSELTTLGLLAIGATALGAFSDIRSAARVLATSGATYSPRLTPGLARALFARYLATAELSLTLAGK